MTSARARELKEQGNLCFQSQDYIGAEALYSKAIIVDPTNPLLYTNRAMARLKLKLFEAVIPDCEASLNLLEQNMKAYYYMAQAQLEVGQKSAALKSALQAYDLCYKAGDKGWERSLPNVVALVLRCKKEVWEMKEKERLGSRARLYEDVEEALQKTRDLKIKEVEEQRAQGTVGEVEARELIEEAREECARNSEEIKRALDKAAEAEGGPKRREVPDWAIDNITFAVMHDPVMTKTGQSYERASIYEHLHRSPTDPLTREPLKIEELRPNLGLKAACEEFLHENGWAVDW